MANLSTWTRNEAEAIYVKVQGQFDILMDLYQELMLLDEDTEATLAVRETKTREVTNDMDNSRLIIADTLATMDKVMKKASAPVAQQASSLHTPRIRVVDTLKLWRRYTIPLYVIIVHYARRSLLINTVINIS